MNKYGTVSVRGLRIYAYHGVLAQERKVGNLFSVDLELTYDASRAMERDDLEGSISYAEMVELVKAEMAKPSALLENVCYRIAGACLERWRAIDLKGRVKLTKLNPPLSAQMEGAAFTYDFP